MSGTKVLSWNEDSASSALRTTELEVVLRRKSLLQSPPHDLLQYGSTNKLEDDLSVVTCLYYDPFEVLCAHQLNTREATPSTSTGIVLEYL